MRQIAIDTNVLVRLFVDDDLVQRDKALELLENADSVIVPTTVFLECVWVLTRSYKMEKTLFCNTSKFFRIYPQFGYSGGRAGSGVCHYGRQWRLCRRSQRVFGTHDGSVVFRYF